MKPLDPHFEKMITAAAAFPQMHEAPLAKVRAGARRFLETGLPSEAVGSIENRSVPAQGHDIPVRIYRPEGAGQRPLVLFFHGGGFAICNLDTHDGQCRQICRRGDCVVVSVDYRLAPEHPYPAALEDAQASLEWALVHAGALGGDPARLAVAGDSAGGNLAAVLARRARDAGSSAIKGQILIYPVTDHYSSGHPSYAERAERCGLTAGEMRWFWDLYLAGQGVEAHPDVSPLRASSLAGLPPACVLTAEYDVLRDEGRAYASALAAAGVPVLHRHYEAVNHGFLNWVGVVDEASQAMDDLTGWIKANL